VSFFSAGAIVQVGDRGVHAAFVRERDLSIATRKLIRRAAHIEQVVRRTAKVEHSFKGLLLVRLRDPAARCACDG
jgi:hypothetical protein